MLFLLLSARILSFSYLLFFFFIILTSNLTNPSLDIKNKVIGKVVSLTFIPTTDTNEAIVTIPMVTKRKIKLLS